MPDTTPAPGERIETEVLSGAEIQALISAGRVVLREAPRADPLYAVLSSAISKLARAIGVPDARSA